MTEDEQPRAPSRPRRRRRGPSGAAAPDQAPSALELSAANESSPFRPLNEPGGTEAVSTPALPRAAEPAAAPAAAQVDERDAAEDGAPEQPSAEDAPAEDAPAEDAPAEADREVASAPEPSAIPPAGIEVNVVVPRGLGRRVNAKLIRQATELALRRAGWAQPASLDVLIVSDEEMREINVTRRGIDEATDVLSFPLLEVRPDSGLAEDFFVLPPETQVHLGDVVISFSRVESQAEEAGHSRERELAFLTVHAVLHILGYDHDTEEKRRRMRRQEEEVLVELGLRRNGA